VRWLLVSISLLLIAASEQQTGEKVVFGVRIATEANSQVVGYIAIKYDGDGIIKSKRVFTSRDEFTKVLAGFWPSPFNPNKVNFFIENKVQGGVLKDSVLRRDYPYCPAFDSLWKLRFSDWPYNNKPLEKGWSLNLFRPSLKQEKYLCDRYGIKHMDSDYIVDTAFWQLLRDVTDSTWIANYKFIQ
jgi:hypothetical protein